MIRFERRRAPRRAFGPPAEPEIARSPERYLRSRTEGRGTVRMAVADEQGGE